MAKNTHDQIARRIAKQRGADYNKGQGPDVDTGNLVVEVETENTVADAGRQLQGFQRPVYVAGATKAAADKALERYKDTSIGVMGPDGKILKKSTRKKKR